MTHVAHQSTLYHLEWIPPLTAQMAMFTFQLTRKPSRNVLQIQMTGSCEETLNLQSDIQFAHMFSKSVFHRHFIASPTGFTFKHFIRPHPSISDIF